MTFFFIKILHFAFMLTRLYVDWAGNLDDRSSTSAYVVFLGINVIFWSKKQKSIFSTEA